MGKLEGIHWLMIGIVVVLVLFALFVWWLWTEPAPVPVPVTDQVIVVPPTDPPAPATWTPLPAVPHVIYLGTDTPEPLPPTATDRPTRQPTATDTAVPATATKRPTRPPTVAPSRTLAQGAVPEVLGTTGGEGISPLVALAGCMLIATGLLAAGAWGYQRLKEEEQGYPLEAQVEPVLLPALYMAICSAYRLSEMAMHELGVLLRGTDKAEIAASVYELLPPDLASMMTEAEFARLVQAVYERFDEFWLEREEAFRETFEEWKTEARE